MARRKPLFHSGKVPDLLKAEVAGTLGYPVYASGP